MSSEVVVVAKPKKIISAKVRGVVKIKPESLNRKLWVEDIGLNFSVIYPYHFCYLPLIFYPSEVLQSGSNNVVFGPIMSRAFPCLSEGILNLFAA